MKGKLYISAIVLSLFTVAGNSNASSEQGTTLPAELIKLEEPVFPPRLRFEGVTEGETRLVLSINEDGEVDDWLPLYSTREEFIKALGTVIDDWQYSPALSHGEPVKAVQRLKVLWRSEGQIVFLDAQQAVQEAYLGNWESAEYKIAEPSQLDESLQILSLVKPKIPVVKNGDEDRKVTFYFYIDEKGNVRMPAIKELHVPVPQALAIAEAVEQWKFKPPRVNGKPVIVKVAQPFVIH